MTKPPANIPHSVNPDATESPVVHNAPAVTAIRPTVGPTTGGQTVRITGTGFTPATAVAIGCTAVGAFTVDSDTQITATTPARPAGTGQVTVTSPAATSSDAVAYFSVPPPDLFSLLPNHGPTLGGNAVTITGSHFASATSVTFGFAAAPFALNSDNEIIATVPAGTGTVHTKVTTAGGTTTGSPYTYIPAPVITDLLPQQGPEGGGNGVIISGSALAFTSEVYFGTTRAAFFAISDNQLVATPPPGVGVAEVAVTTPGGTSGELTYTYLGAPGM